MALALEGEREVVVRVGVLRHEMNRALVGGDGLGQALQLIEDVAEIEEGEGVVGIGLGGVAVELLGLRVLAEVVVDGAEIDGGGGVAGAQLEDFAVELCGLRQGRRIFFELHGALEDLLHIDLQCGVVGRSADDGEMALRRGVEVKGELARDGIDQGARVAEGEARAAADSGAAADDATAPDSGPAQDSGTAPSGDPLACLRNLPVSTLLAASQSDAGLGIGNTFAPVVDDDFFADQPRTLYESGKIAKTPYILGSNNDEGTLFVLNATPVADQAGLSAAIHAQYGDAGAAIAALYPPSAFDGGTPNAYQAALTRIVGDSTLVCSTYDSALLAANQGVAVSMYNFDIPVVIPGLVGPDPGELYLGASHGSELSFVFGTSPQFATDTASADISKLMQRYWTRFAAAGDPNGGSDLAWPKFTATSNQRMQFTLTPSVVTNFRAAECTFWIGVYESQFGAGVVSSP